MSQHPRFVERKIVTIQASLNTPSYNCGVEDAAAFLERWAGEGAGGSISGLGYEYLMNLARQLREDLVITPVMLKSIHQSVS